MTRLKQRDLAAFSRALATLGADTAAETLSDRILACLRGLFDCDFASFSLLDLRRIRFHAVNFAPLVPDWPGTEAHRRHLSSDPAAAHIMRTRHPGALKISDFVSLREYRSLRVYTEVFGRVGCDRRLGFALQDDSPVSLVATLNRKGRDFSDEDRTLLDLLRPHLFQANAQAHVDKQLRAEQTRALTQVGDALRAGLGEIDPAGRLLWLTPRGAALLKTFFPGQLNREAAKQHLPTDLEKRLAPALHGTPAASPHDPAKPPRLAWRFAGPGARVLRVRLLAKPGPGGWQLLLEETTIAAPVRLLAHALKLTAREAEVLHCLKQGKTNWEIGAILGVTEKTAGKHLENIYVKLNVENRTAAVRVAAEANAGF